MTRPDKHAARFGDRYRPPADYRRLRKAVHDAKPAIHPTDILDRIDNTLAYMTDAQTGRSDEPWPYGRQF